MVPWTDIEPLTTMTTQPEESNLVRINNRDSKEYKRKSTWKKAKFWRTSLKIGTVIFWWGFPSAKPKQLLRNEKG